MSDDPKRENPFHPLAETYPLMGPDELAALADDIKANGLLQSVCMLGGLVLDGRNRWLACRMAGVECHTWEWGGAKDEATLRALVESLNEHRRHLTPEFRKQRREERVARAAAMRQGGASLRSIAEAEGVSEKQIRLDLEKATAEGSAVEPESGRVSGKDGKSRPASRKKAAPEPEPEPDGEEADEPEEVAPPTTPPAPAKQFHPADAVLDALGNPVPKHLRDVFADPKLRDEIERVKGWRVAVEHASSARRVAALSPYNPYLRCKNGMYQEHVRGAWEALAAAEQTLVDSLPCAVCPRCSGIDGGCGDCSHAGWVPRWQYDTLTEHAAFEQDAQEAGQ